MATVREQLEAKYGKPKAVLPTGGLSVRQQLEAKYKQPKKAFTYDVPVSEVSRKNKLSQFQVEAEEAKKQSEKANSKIGFAKNFGKAVIENIAPSEVGLGKSLQKIFGNQSDTYIQTIDTLSKTQANTIKAIRDKESRGEDATKLKQVYNDNVAQLEKLQEGLNGETTLPTTGQVSGQLAGTALDLLTAGTYSKAKTAGMKSFKLGQQVIKPSVVPAVATAVGVPELGQISAQNAVGLFTKKGLSNVAMGAGLGYAGDVSSGLQGLRGEDRTGEKSFIPGLGTAIGTTIPVISEANASFKSRPSALIKNDIAGAFDEANNVLTELPDVANDPAQKAQLFQRVKTNIVDGLKAHKLKDVADIIDTVDPSKYDNLGDYKVAIDNIVKNKGKYASALDNVTLKTSDVTPTQYKKLLEQNRVKPKTSFAPATIDLSPKEKEYAIKYADLIKDKDPVKNTLNVIADIADKDKQVGSYLSSNNAIFNKGELKNYLKSSMDEVTDILIPEETLSKAKDRLVNDFVDSLDTNNMTSLWEARKQFDKYSKAFSGSPTLKKEIEKIFRDAVQSYISDRTDNVTYKNLMKEMSGLFSLRDILTRKATKERVLSGVTKWMKENPGKVKTAEGAAAIIGLKALIP